MQRDQRVAEPGDRGARGVPRRGTARGRAAGRPGPRGPAGLPPSSTTAAWVPAAPPICTGKASRSRSSYASRTPASHCATLSPNVVGTACWVSVRATIGVSRCVAGEHGEPLGLSRGSRPAAAATASCAISISAESTTSWLVRPRCSHAAAVGCSSSSALRSSPTSAIAGLPPASVSSAATPRGSPRPGRRGRRARPAERSRRRRARRARPPRPRASPRGTSRRVKCVVGAMVARPEESQLPSGGQCRG